MQPLSNFFDFAKKELTQDGFLLWLFDNNKRNKSIASVVHSLLHLFLGEQCPQDTSQIAFSTYAQYRGIDVILEFFIGDEQYVLAIEDKTNSFLRNYLPSYSEIIQKRYPSCRHLIQIVFQTDYMIEIDRKEAERAGWLHFDIFEIDDALMSAYSSGESCEILANFVSHIREKRKVLESGRGDVRKWGRFDSRWKLLFDRIPRLPNSNIEVFGNSHYRFLFSFLLIGPFSLELQFASFRYGGGPFTAAVRLKQGDFNEKVVSKVEKRLCGLIKFDHCRVSKRHQRRLICTFLFTDDVSLPITSDSLVVQLGLFQRNLLQLAENYRKCYALKNFDE